jgi:hypothetical protein
VIVRAAAPALVVALAGEAYACPPAVRLVGDPALVAEVAQVLAARGIATGLACATVEARVEQRDATIAIAIDSTQAIRREVREVETAATVIESFARDDAAPLLAARDVRRPTPPPTAAQPEPPAHKPRGLRVFAGLESAIGSDESRWFGLHLGGCWMLDVVCLAGRVRTSNRTDEHEMEPWRESWEVLVGVDVPFAIGRWSIEPGIAFGPSGMSTRGAEDREDTNGIRGEAHVTVSIPVASRFAVDVHVAANLLQSVHFDERSHGTLPPEPWGFARLGVGLRYGAR